MTGTSSGAAPAKAGAMADLAPRLVSGVVMAALALGTLWRGGELFVWFWAIAAIVVGWEWQSLVDAPARWPRVATTGVAVAAAAFFARRFSPDLSLFVLLVGAGVAAWLGGEKRRLWCGFGVIYAGALAVAVIGLRLSLEGLEAVLWLFAIVWGTDIMAYFGGRALGGPKLWPRVSPSKTWSGFLVGVSCGALAGLGALRARDALVDGAWPGVLALGVITAMLSQGGDLFESSMKRRFGVKDSSHLIPGHGGFMDRLDGFIAAAVFAALVGGLRNGPVELAIGVLRW